MKEGLQGVEEEGQPSLVGEPELIQEPCGCRDSIMEVSFVEPGELKGDPERLEWMLKSPPIIKLEFEVERRLSVFLSQVRKGDGDEEGGR